MIISRQRGYIFVHIPKTGGTSMALALEAKAAADDILIGDTPKARKRRRRLKGVQARGRLWKHSTLQDIEGLMSADEIAQMRVFTMVRNPWDRIVSYYHWLREQSFDHPAVGLARALSFSDFLNDPGMIASLSRHSYGSYVRAGGVEHCALFVRLEHLDEDLPRLEALLDMKLGVFPHENTSVREGRYQDQYSDEDRALVGRIARGDIVRFGYQF